MCDKGVIISDSSKCAPIIVEDCAYQGVKKIARKAAADMGLVIGREPCIIDGYPKDGKAAVVFATAGKSSILDKLERNGKIDLTDIRNRREVYGIFFIENPCAELEKMLVVAGSDKRGTIYGIFSLSEKFGVSPLVYWGDVHVEQKGRIVFDRKMEEISKEPSVRYRGFFINDEWPCFGNWAVGHFGGFCAEMYDKVFELLLRLKGNYLWPAMWSASFALDGPADENEKLADEYGIIMGNSHHEPCLRAGEEWDIYKGRDSEYGTEWDYTVNKNGLLKFWRDGLKRSGKYENIITVGMRGERDSVMPGSNSLEESIALWKDIISRQQELISAYADTESYVHPRLLAVYKEVEEYYYGTDTVPGLKDWEGLRSVILLFCEDNYGNLRRLPDASAQKNSGGLGMYYHLDYHGAPVSYEWFNTRQLAKIWEQMTQAYEYGIHDVWIVNAGDIKGNEFPLSYFMDMAYDFDRWGTHKKNSSHTYTMEWVNMQFGAVTDTELVYGIADILNESIDLAAMCKPEALNSHVFHAFHYDEADRMIKRIKILREKSDSLKRKLPSEYQPTYYSLIEYQMLLCTNTLLMHLYAGKNEHYAKQGKVVANQFGNQVRQAISRDREYREQFAHFKKDKWRGMELGMHTGFVKWNEDGCRWPMRYTVEPLEKAQLIVSAANEERIAVKNYGEPEHIAIRDFLYPGADMVRLEIANGGKEGFLCTLQSAPCEWLQIEWEAKQISMQEFLSVSCITSKLPETPQKHTVYIQGADARVAVDIWGCRTDTQQFPAGAYFERNGIVAIHAGDYSYKRSGSDRDWELLEHYGKLGLAYKALPAKRYHEGEVLPALGYYIVVDWEGEYHLEVWSEPLNPLTGGGRVCFGLSINGMQWQKIPSVLEGYQAGEPSDEEWSRGVVDQMHKTRLTIHLKRGVNTVEFYAVDPEFVFEGMFISKDPLEESYLGPTVSYHRG